MPEAKPAKPFRKYYGLVRDEEGNVIEKVVIETPELDAQFEGEKVTKKVFDDTVIESGEKPTEITLSDDEVPKLDVDADSLPKKINVRNKKTKQEFTVHRDHYLQNRGDLELC